MNYLKTYQIFENITNPIEIIKTLNKDKDAKYTLNKDNSIDVKGNVDLSEVTATSTIFAIYTLFTFFVNPFLIVSFFTTLQYHHDTNIYVC
jgi:hypothetical protein